MLIATLSAVINLYIYVIRYLMPLIVNAVMLIGEIRIAGLPLSRRGHYSNLAGANLFYCLAKMLWENRTFS